MVVEKLIPKKEDYLFARFTYFTEKLYRYGDSSRVFSSRYEYWYDGVKFLIGNFPGESLGLLEVETGAFAVMPQEVKKPSAETLIEAFKKKLQKSGKSIREVIQTFKGNNLDLELWVINSLNI